MKQTLYSLSFVLCTVIWGVLAFSDDGNNRPIRIGAALALTGDQAAPNQAFVEGIQLALEEQNKRPIWQTRKLEVKTEDGQLLPRQSFAAIKKLIEVDRVTALITGSVVESKAGAPLLNKAKIPTITLWDASPEVESLGTFIFSIGLWTPSSAEVAASFIQSKLYKERPYIFNSQDEWSGELEKTFRNRIQASGGTVVGVSTFVPGESDFRTSIIKARTSGADVLYVTVGYNIPAFFRQLKQVNWNVPVVTSDILSESLIEESPSLFEEVYQTQIYTPVAPRTAHMLALYEKKYNRPCTWLPWVAWGYDSFHLLAEAISHVGPDGEKIAAYLTKVRGYEGASGEITMTPGRSAPRRPSVFQIKNGSFNLVD